MQVKIIIFRRTLWYNSLGDPTRQHEVWRKILLYYVNANWSDWKQNIPSYKGGGGTNICQKFWWVSLCLQKHSDWMPSTGMNCLNANFITYATQLEGHFSFMQNLIFFMTSYTYKLLRAFPQKASVENSSAQ